MFLQSLFSRSKYAGIVSTVIYFCGVLLNSVVSKDDVTHSSKLLGSILPQVALCQGCAVFANYEGTGIGLDGLTVKVLYNGYSFDSALWMLLFDFFLFFILGLYMDKVIPSDFGQRLSPIFCLQPSYYRGCRRERRRGANARVDDAEENMLGDENEAANEFESAQMPKDNYEAPPVICRRLEKTNDYLKVENL